MVTILTRQGIRLLAVIFLVQTLIFIGLNLSGDPVRTLLPPTATAEDAYALRQKLGLDKPLFQRYLIFLLRASYFDFGNSIRTGRQAWIEVLPAVRPTLMLSTVVILFSSMIGVFLGVIIAINPRKFVSKVLLIFSLSVQSLPTFWIGLLLIFVFGLKLKLLPTYGYGKWYHIVLPSLTITCFLLAAITRITAISVSNVLKEPFIQFARAKGLSERKVLWKHVFRNALIPIITQIVTQLRFVLGGSVVVESIFGWPGLGRLLAQSAIARDFPVVSAATFLITILIMFINLCLDFLYIFLDPRIRYN